MHLLYQGHGMKTASNFEQTYSDYILQIAVSVPEAKPENIWQTTSSGIEVLS